jgi:AcrR family transcriptional regulator
MRRDAETLDRRTPHHGDRRRAALLTALDELLQEHDLEDIAIADISARAGVTRSAFYFYFENKAACVAALGAEMYQEAIAAADHLFADDVPPGRRIQRMVDSLFETWQSHRYLYRATLEASRTSAAIRELWDTYRESFVEPVATLIEEERAAGAAPPGPAGVTLATTLLELSDSTLERLDASDGPGIAQRAEALATIWWRAIYGEAPGPAPKPAAAKRRKPARRKGP